MKSEQMNLKERFLNTNHHLVYRFHMATKFHTKQPAQPDILQY